jgi:hypothetical protein
MLSVSLDQAHVCVIVFMMNDCSACEEYVPRFRRRAAAYRQYMPILIVDVEDPRYTDLADRLNVTGTPATFALKRGYGTLRLEGSVSDREIEWLLGVAARGAG